ncbi:MAG: V-type ATP synthase subunit F [Anaerolineales bacterium]
MKLQVIGNQAAVWGLALTGVGGRVVTTVEELHTAVNEALTSEEVGILLVTEDAVDLDRRWLEHLMVSCSRPLIVEIPGPEGPSSERPSLSEVVRRTIGVKI